MIRIRFLRGHGSGKDLGVGLQGDLRQMETDGIIKEHAEALSPKEGVDYNCDSKVPSSEIKYPVKEAYRSENVHRKPDKGRPNSVQVDYRKGKPYWERYYDGNGKPYLDIDYTDHHDPSKHTNPHYHRIIVDKDGHIDRGENINV